LDEWIAPLAQLAITVLFPLLAADLSWAELSPLGWGGMLCVLALSPLRWLVVQLSGLGLASFGWREKLLVAWVAPRGIVTAAVASLFALQLNQAGVAGGGPLKGLVFLTILLSVSLQGLTAPALAARLGLVNPEQEGPEASEAAGDALAGFAAGLQQQPGGEQVGPLETAE
ncbi:MAG: sodium:proton antiporter, partial [Vulcanococcus sp.]